ncbi:hypothetical protein [Rhizobium leguminosarum]|uniref:hypothetical protein n=1 Tax=Rhizobium leguminosarum TaxID=384 RepID=UPI001F16BE01|nr:hypothetical protein [Rhizobium leguminosarum]UIK20256.1 hypothetical protein LZK79_26970 [Rhizobium leguminosarum]
MYELRKLMVLAVNEAVKQGLLSLEAPPNDGPTDEDGHLIAEIAGRPSVVNWSSISAGEVRVSVWWDYDHSKNPQANEKGDYRESFSSTQPLAKDSHYPKFVGVTVSGWLNEKRRGTCRVTAKRIFLTFIYGADRRNCSSKSLSRNRKATNRKENFSFNKQCPSGKTKT